MRRTLYLAAALLSIVLLTAGAFLLTHNTVHAATVMAPRFEVDPFWPKPLPNHWVLGQTIGVSADSHDNIWIIHRPGSLEAGEKHAEGNPPVASCCVSAPPVLEFDQAGNLVRSWGGPGQGYDWPISNHGIVVDSKDNVWIGSNGRTQASGRGALNGQDEETTGTFASFHDTMVLKFTVDGKFLMQIGKPSQSKGSNDTENLRLPAKIFVDEKANEIYVADGYGNHRVIVLDADTGAFKRMWGAYGKKPVDSDPCPPVTLKSVPDGPGPDQFSIVHSVRVSNDGIVYVADRENRRVQTFTLEGKFLKQLIRQSAPFARSLAFSRDPDQQFLYVGGGDDVVVVNRKTMEIVSSIQGGGMLAGPHLMQTDAKGNLYLALTTKGVQKLTFKGVSAAGK